MGVRERIMRAMLELIDRQITNRNPPETRQAFDRLVENGYSPSEARCEIGRVVTQLIADNLSLQREFDPRAYARVLSELPAALERTTA